MALKIVDLAEFWSERGGGVRTYLTHMLREGTRLGHDVCVVAPGPRDEVSDVGGGTLVRVAGPPLLFYDRTYHALLRVGRARRAIRERRPDVLQVSSPFVAGLLGARLDGIPVRSLVGHADLPGAYARPAIELLVREPGEALLAPVWSYLRRLANRYDATVVAGPWMADPMRAHGCPRVEVVPFGIDRTGLGPDRHDPDLRRELLGRAADAKDAALLVCAGRLAFEKRVSLVVEAVRRLGRERPVALAVLGEGPERGRLERRAAGLAVQFLGFKKGAGRDQFARVLASADALVHGSATETFGFTLAEALCSGTPIVVPDAGAAFHQGDAACREVYPAGGGPEACASAVRRLLAGPREAQRAAALRWSASVPTLSQHFEKLFALYARMLDERS